LPGALEVFRSLVERDPERAVFHVGLANAAILIFDSTRAEDTPDTAMMTLAAHHAREGRRLDPMSGEAWITEGVVLERAGDRQGAAAALRRGVELEPLCLRHHIRRAFGSWGEDRIAAAATALRLSPRLPDAHLLMATVFVARDNAAEAERQLDVGLAAMPDPEEPSGLQVGLYWLKGLLRHLRDSIDALVWLDRELDLEPHGHLYAHECCASALYAKGAMLADTGDAEAARTAYSAALARTPRHAMARAGLAILDGRTDRLAAAYLQDREAPLHIDEAMARAAILVHAGRVDAAAELCHRALAVSPPGNGGWLLPIDPLLRVARDKTPWTRVLDLLRRRAEDGA
jgi:tetratricopeptide (TPR) repeat protein